MELTTPNGGTASCRSAVFGCEEDGRGGNWDFRRMGEDFERTKEDGRGRERDSERMGEDFERKKEELEDGQRDFEEGETRLSRGRKQNF